MSRTITVAFFFWAMALWLCFYAFSKFCIIYILVYFIRHAEFSQDDVSATIMNVPGF